MTLGQAMNRELRLTAPPRYHRNGSAGDVFWVVHFLQRQGREWHALVATVPAHAFDPDGEGNPLDQAGERRLEAQVFVVDPADRDARFDGPYFAAWIVAACREADSSGAGYIDAAPARTVKRIPGNPGGSESVSRKTPLAAMTTRTLAGSHRLGMTCHFDGSWSWHDPLTDRGGEGFPGMEEAYRGACDVLGLPVSPEPLRAAQGAPPPREPAP